jgi:inner membrane transporter RhtA
MDRASTRAGWRPVRLVEISVRKVRLNLSMPPRHSPSPASQSLWSQRHFSRSDRYNLLVRRLTLHLRAILPVGALLLAMISVQSGASIAKTLFPIAGPVGIVTVRVGFGTLILCLALRPWRARIRREAWPPLMVYGLALGTMNFLYYQALDRLPVGIAVAVEFIGPLTVAVLTSRRAIDFLWIAIAAAGFVLLLPPGRQSSVTGILFALGAGACWGLYIVFGQRAGHHLGTQTVALGSVISALLVVPVGLLHARSALLSRNVLLPGLAVAVLSTALPYTLEMIALTRLPTRTFGVLMSLEPAVGTLAGWLLLQERLTVWQCGAIALVMSASIGATATARPNMTAPVPD